MATGDVLRVRVLGTKDDWCTCQVEMVSANGQSVALRVVEGVLRVDGGLMVGALAVHIEYCGAYEVFTGAELEIERWQPSPPC